MLPPVTFPILSGVWGHHVKSTPLQQVSAALGPFNWLLAHHSAK